ncbi:elongator complex protein 6-like isoform X2 [Dendronephthya gigantea]|uniref:elongator complex protein 6-like isoform X2 n=1 Tax=Dendronephthya gigantea TaxID=151771 RepID=UPI00106A53D5|nr:elongator complex protein 6-like isoform X2 [Dendronephthya gigantea]
MFIALNKLLDIDEDVPPKGKYYLISESHNDGSFLIHHFLSFFLKGGYNVCFIALVQSFTHYSSIAQKMGVNLNTTIQKGKLTFVEGLTCAVQSLETNEMALDLQDNPFTGLTSSDSKFSLKLLHDKIQEEISKFENDQPFLLLIDDVSAFLGLGVSVVDIQDFVQYCLLSVSSSDKGCLVTLVHADHDTGESEEENLERHLIYKCDTQLHVKGLSTGFCREVHGELEIINHNLATKTGRASERIVQYKIMDKNVNFFAPGNSASVL